MTQDYAPPWVTVELGRQTQDSVAARNAFSLGAAPAFLERIDGISVAELAQEFGTPLFVFSERSLREKARRLRQVFTERYRHVEFAWSYKTNYINAVCQVFRSEGWMADVTSQFEYEKARRLGFPPERILFNGPCKQQAILGRALREGALVQIDNWDELHLIEALVNERDMPRPIDVGLRLCIDAGLKGGWTKFGFFLANGEAERAAGRIIANPRLRLHTLHTHIGTYILEPDAYGRAARQMVALRDDIEASFGHLVPCLNLGGGFPSLSLLHGMAGPAAEAVPPIEHYAEAITAVLNRLPENRRPILRLETGRYLVDEAGYLVTSVCAVKSSGVTADMDGDLSGLAHKGRMIASTDANIGYVVDGGINLLYTAAWFRIEALPAHRPTGQPMRSRLYGPLCMAIDVIRDTVNLPPLRAGDILTFHPVGAYNTNQSMRFIFYRPAVVMLTGDGGREIVVRRETLDDADHVERLPRQLAGT